MKHVLKTYFLGVCFFALFFPLALKGQPEKKEQVRQLLEKGEFTVEFHKALPLGKTAKNLFPTYEMHIKGTIVDTFLPYFGRHHHAPADPSNLSLILKDTEVDLVQEKGKKGKTIFRFSTKIPHNELLDFTLTVEAGGMAQLSVTSSTRSAITYLGQVKL